MNYYTGNKDVDAEILLKLSDEDLGNACQVNSYVRSICKSEAFWAKKLFNLFERARKITLEVSPNFYKKFNFSSRPINYEKIKKIKEEFGFDTFLEFYKWLKDKFNPNILFLFYNTSIPDSERYKRDYQIEKDKLPDYINFDILVNNIKREILIKIYEERDDGEVEEPDIYLPSIMPGYLKKWRSFEVDDDYFDLMKSLWKYE